MPLSGSLKTEANGSAASTTATGNNLPPLRETFPVDKYPLRDIGTGFTAQSVRGPEAESCAGGASEMLAEWRATMVSSVSSEGSATLPFEADSFPVPDLPLPEGAAQDGLLILRNERVFPGMVGINLPLKGTLWVREDGTFNLSGFFRRQIPKFEAAAMLAAAANMEESRDVYHAVYRPVLETAVAKQHFKVMRTAIEAGLQHYKNDDSPQRLELVELRRRVMALRAQMSGQASGSSNAAAGMTRSDSTGQLQPRRDRDSWVSTEEVMETRRRVSDSKRVEAEASVQDSGDGARRVLCTSGELSDEADEAGKGRVRRSSSGNERSLKIAEQVLTGAAPNQKSPFRLWKSDTGEESYDKKRPS